VQTLEQQGVVVVPVSKLKDTDTATLKSFDCNDQFLNSFATKKLVKYDKRNLHKGFVAICDNRIVGFVTTKVASMAREHYPEKSLPKSIPVLSLEQIATDINYRGRSIGRRLLKEALNITVMVSESTGVKGLQLWSHPDALGFYEKHGFQILATQQQGDIELTLMMLPVETIRLSMGV